MHATVIEMMLYRLLQLAILCELLAGILDPSQGSQHTQQGSPATTTTCMAASQADIGKPCSKACMANPADLAIRGCMHNRATQSMMAAEEFSVAASATAVQPEVKYAMPVLHPAL